jgi:hypothetical protein
MSDGGTPMGSTPIFPRGGAAMGTNPVKSQDQLAFEQRIAMGGAGGGGLTGPPLPCTHPRWGNPWLTESLVAWVQSCVVCNETRRIV